MEPLISARAAARRCGRRLNTVLGWLESGQVPAIRGEGRWYVRPEDLDAFLRTRALQEASERRGEGRKP